MAAGAATLSVSFFSSTLTAATLVGANASANVLQPIAIVLSTTGNEMNFGDIVPDAAATADVILLPAGTIASSAPATTSGSPSAGDFDVTGSNNASFTISLPADLAVTLTDSGGNSGDPMPLKTFTTSAGAGTLDGTGAQTISVGATLVVGVGQVESTYTGTYDVTVNYQ